MFYIDPKQKHIIEARKVHVKQLLLALNKRIDNCPNQKLKLFLRKNILDLLRGKPQKLLNIHKALFTEFPDFETYLNEKSKTKYFNANIRNNNEPIFAEIFRIIDYDSFGKKTEYEKDYDAYNLADNLKINTCTYCNRLYTKTVITKLTNGKIEKITRPTFDHWLPKSKFPLLALSFYNLIPSCTVCNSSVKSSELMTFDLFLHPYLDEKINFQFSYRPNSLNVYEFKIKNDGDDLNKKSLNTAEFFKLKEIYETHEYEITELIKIKQAYSITYLKTLKALFKGAGGFSNEDIYRFAFGTEINEAKFEKRPLSRMKRDILVELGIIQKNNK